MAGSRTMAEPVRPASRSRSKASGWAARNSPHAETVGLVAGIAPGNGLDVPEGDGEVGRQCQGMVTRVAQAQAGAAGSHGPMAPRRRARLEAQDPGSARLPGRAGTGRCRSMACGQWRWGGVMGPSRSGWGCGRGASVCGEGGRGLSRGSSGGVRSRGDRGRGVGATGDGDGGAASWAGTGVGAPRRRAGPGDVGVAGDAPAPGVLGAGGQARMRVVWNGVGGRGGVPSSASQTRPGWR